MNLLAQDFVHPVLFAVLIWVGYSCKGLKRIWRAVAVFADVFCFFHMSQMKAFPEPIASLRALGITCGAGTFYAVLLEYYCRKHRGQSFFLR